MEISVPIDVWWISQEPAWDRQGRFVFRGQERIPAQRGCEKGFSHPADVPFAYQSEFPEHTNIYDDFNDVKNHDHAMAYPTVNGVIDTVQWEGYLEGVDDLRYLMTLLKTIEHARKKGREDLA